MITTSQTPTSLGISRRLGLRLERLWLSALPSLTRDYVWVRAEGLQLYGSTHHQKKLLLMERDSFEPLTVRLFKEAVKPGMVVLDIGAYIGYYALLAAQRVGAQGRVYAFECDPRSYRFLLHNVNLNNCSGDVVPIPKGVADQAGLQRFFLYGGDLTRSSLWDEHGAETALEVECSTVDEILGNQPVDVIKMDIEGGEIRALKGMAKTLRNSHNVIMFVECNPSALSYAGGSAAGLVAELEEYGFRVQVIDDHERCLKPVSHDIYAVRDARGKRNYCNLYCSKSGYSCDF